jgi:hypothetical protein
MLNYGEVSREHRCCIRECYGGATEAAFVRGKKEYRGCIREGVRRDYKGCFRKRYGALQSCVRER